MRPEHSPTEGPGLVLEWRQNPDWEALVTYVEPRGRAVTECMVKVVQARLRHASAKTKLDSCGHLWPDKDDSTRAAIDVAMTAREDKTRTAGGG